MAMAEQSTVYSRDPEMRGTIKLTALFTQPQDKEEVAPCDSFASEHNNDQ